MREKIQNLLWRFDICRAEESETIDKIEELADDFAIGFAEWIGVDDGKKLLKIYKIEKGL
jgi:hypothetical protein